jgi:hypothetical protein
LGQFSKNCRKIVKKLFKIWSWDPGSRGQKGTGSRIRIRNTGLSRLVCNWTQSNTSVLRLPSSSQIIPYGTLSCWRLDSVADPYVFGPPGSGSIRTRYGSGSGSFYHQAKIVLLFCGIFMTFYLSKIKNYVNVVSNSNKQKKLGKKYFLVPILNVTEENTRIWIRIC